MASSSLLHDTPPSPPPADHSAFRPYACPKHAVTRNRYITSNDPRGYLPVYEYAVNGQWLMVDADNGYVLWTGIWKALGNAKADIVKMLESQPDLAPQLRRVRGGYLKIQGTWINYEIALRLARRVAWPIRDDLVPIFGPTFPSTCLTPGQPGYGQLCSAPARRRTRRPNPSPSPAPLLHLQPLAPHPQSLAPHPHPHPQPLAPHLQTLAPHPQHLAPHPQTLALAPLPPPPPPQPRQISLPPISALACSASTDPDASAVLRRLRQDDADCDPARTPAAQAFYAYPPSHYPREDTFGGVPPW